MKSVLLPCSVGKLHFVEGSSIARAVQRNIIHDPGVEFFTLKYLEHLFPFFDVGANVGLFALYAARLSGFSDKIVAFEPEEDNIKLFKENVAAHGWADRITLEPFALSKNDGEIAMGVIDCGLSKKSEVDSVTIPCRSLVSYVGEMGIVPSFVKIDVEGAELDVLKGFASSADIENVIFELEFSWRDHGPRIAEFLRILPLETRSFEFLLAQSEEAELAKYAEMGITKNIIHDTRTNRALTLVRAETEAEFEAITQVLAVSTAEVASRKWELAIVPKSKRHENEATQMGPFLIKPL